MNVQTVLCLRQIGEREILKQETTNGALQQRAAQVL